MEDHVKRLMADVLDLNAKAIDERTVRDSVASWDSLKHISLCLALEEEFKVSFEVHEMEDMLSYKDVLRILRQKL